MISVHQQRVADLQEKIAKVNDDQRQRALNKIQEGNTYLDNVKSKLIDGKEHVDPGFTIDEVTQYLEIIFSETQKILNEQPKKEEKKEDKPEDKKEEKKEEGKEGDKMTDD